MSYEYKYHKYKKLYLNLKQQRGGNENIVENKFILVMPLEQFNNIISNLKSLASCDRDIIDINELKHNLKSIYENLGNKALSKFGIYNVAEEKPLFNILSLPDLRNRRNEICKVINSKILPELEKTKELQEKFIQYLKDVPTSGRKFDISKYIEFAKERDLLDQPVDEIFNKYFMYIEEEEKTNDLLKEFIMMEKPAGPTMPAYPRSKSGHPCTSQCVKSQTLFGNQCTCKMDPYKTLTGTHNWDYCPEEECAAAKNL